MTRIENVVELPSTIAVLPAPWAEGEALKRTQAVESLSMETFWYEDPPDELDGE